MITHIKDFSRSEFINEVRNICDNFRRSLRADHSALECIEVKEEEYRRETQYQKLFNVFLHEFARSTQ